MPYIPRQFAATRGISPELTTIPRKPPSGTQPPVPYHGSSKTDDLSNYAKNEHNKTQLQKQMISPQKWDVSPDRVLAFLTGQKSSKEGT